MIGSVIQCIRDINAFEFPKEILSLIQPVKRLIKEAFYEVSTQSLSIFNQFTFNSTQGKKYLEELEIGLSEQIEKVQECLEEEKEVKEDDDEMECSEDSVLQRVHLELRNYFIRIKLYLRKKKFSNCAWKIVGVEIRRCFFFFYDLTKLLKRG
uniref:interferon kappa n=1 Tax=Jaculus jaculus TaxID=51337 RepID=UPI001E1B5D20|nr:interferon kappa [Jaculus jaculus]